MELLGSPRQEEELGEDVMRSENRAKAGHHNAMASCPQFSTLQRRNTENSKQIFPGKELHGYSPNSYIHVSVSDLQGADDKLGQFLSQDI
jgi:hypothetical protein